MPGVPVMVAVLFALRMRRVMMMVRLVMRMVVMVMVVRVLVSVVLVLLLAGMGVRMFMAMGMHMIVMVAVARGLVVQRHVHTRSVNAAALVVRNAHRELVVDAQPGKLGREAVRIHAQIDHGRKVHVAADAAKAIIVQDIHGLSAGLGLVVRIVSGSKDACPGPGRPVIKGILPFV
jgi:hypothetical protein